MVVRPVRPGDAEQLLAVYAPYVRDTAVTFEYEVPSLLDFSGRVLHTLQRYPYLAALDGTRLLGFAYTGPFHPRAAYGWAAETSIYVAPDARGKGIGPRLYRCLEEVSRRQNVLSLAACIAYPVEEDETLTLASVRFHAREGYHMAARFHLCAYKFDRWYDMVWMEKSLAPRPASPAPFRPFPCLTRDELLACGVECDGVTE